MLGAILAAVLTIATALVYQQTRPRILRNGQKLRHPPDTLPFLGNAIKFLQPRHVLFDWCVQQQKRFGRETYEISVPSLPPGVVINDPAILEFVLKNETLFTKGEFFRKRSWDLFGNGIINADGEVWKAQRKAGLKFFAGTNLEVMVEDVMPEVYASTREKLIKAAEADVVVDMAEALLDFTTSVVGQMAYDMEIDASSPFSRAFNYASHCTGLRFQNPLWHITEPFTGSKFREALIEVKRFGRKIVTNAKTRRSHIAFESLIDNEEPVFGSLIDSLIESLRNPQLVADSALNFLSAGRDTTAQSMTWMLYSLLRHPAAKSKLQQEIDSLWSDLCSSPPPTTTNTTSPTPHSNLTISHLQPTQIPYTTSTFYESLRLHPTVPFEIKQCEQDTTLPDGTFLPKTSLLVWCIWSMTLSEETYGPDASIFRPERWLVDGVPPSPHQDETPVKPGLRKFSPYEFPVFNAGPRACLGKKMAELMAGFVFVVLLRDFEFDEVGIEMDEKGRPKERISQNSLTLPMLGGLPCRVKIRAGRE